MLLIIQNKRCVTKFKSYVLFRNSCIILIHLRNATGVTSKVTEMNFVKDQGVILVHSDFA